MEGTTDTGSRISRRTLIKRGAVLGTAAWAAPVVSSVSSPAHAAGSASCQEVTCTQVTFGTTVIRLRCRPAPGYEGCLCRCAGDLNSPCAAADPCTVRMVCEPDPTCTF